MNHSSMAKEGSGRRKMEGQRRAPCPPSPHRQWRRLGTFLGCNEEKMPTEC